MVTKKTNKYLADYVQVQLKKSTAPHKKELLQLADIYFAGLPEGEFARTDDHNFEAHLTSVLQFIEHRKPTEKLKIRVHNPAYTRHTVVEILADDQPFLLDSTWVELSERDLEIHHSYHPLLCTERGADGHLRRFSFCTFNEDAKPVQPAEALVHVEVDRIADDELQELENNLRDTLHDAIEAVKDFDAMLTRMKNLITHVEQEKQMGTAAQRQEDLAFLHWLVDNNYIFLGYRHYNIIHEGKDVFMQVSPKTGLGILRDHTLSSVTNKMNVAHLPTNVAHYIKNPRLLIITKALSKSRVHRRADLDYVGIKEFDDKGKMVGEHRFVGLFTSKAYNTPSSQIPIVGHKMNEVLSRERKKGMHGHNLKALVHILETYPKDELFQIDIDDLQRIATGILHLQERQNVRLFVRKSAHERTVSCLVFIPKERMSSRLRETISTILMEAYQGEDLEFNVNYGDFPLARIFYKIRLKPHDAHLPDDQMVEKLVRDAAFSWSDELRKALISHSDAEEGVQLFKSYSTSLRAGYRDSTTPQEAVFDIAALEQLSEHNTFHSRFCPPDSNGNCQLRLYRFAEQIELSNIMPLFDNFGLQVSDESSSAIPLRRGNVGWVHTFYLKMQPNQMLHSAEVQQNLVQALTLAWHGKFEGDTLNALVAEAGMNVGQIVLLRAFVAYIQQIGSTHDQSYIRATLKKHAHLARLLVELFETRFNPGLAEATAKQKTTKLKNQLEEGLAQVSVLDEDNIIRRILGIIFAMVRTNAFQRGDNTAPLAFKFRSELVPNLVKPRPLFEIFVYHSMVEGIHLRGGKVARGGLRWSDRPSDFRTEVLGLMKAQMTKNAVIVPVGSKGGFVIKNTSCDPVSQTCDRAQLMKEVQERYQIFIGCLLSVTDNYTNGGDVVSPRMVKCWDEADPYLVVAADKGTATFSDLANAVAAQADYWEGIQSGFWLGDAFASGGSQGYDHKKMAITARGAWESVKHHFRRMGKDIQAEDFSVIGIGDMAGDVFGNGMLLSEHICLQAAFNHLHIFVDPTPNAASSFAERQRLFNTPGSSWDDYDRKLISKGGGVFKRSDKSIPLSKEMQTMLGTDKTAVSPNELIKMILTMEVELFWNGGIGTFVKATSENNADVGDRANNAIRVNGNELKAKVVGEGGNLGFTQRGRIEYALNGGRLNQDAIDNSAGVDCSDHEVNIKILLRLAQDAGKLTLANRNKLLVQMTDDVAALVLRDNYLQTQVISIKEREGTSATDTFYRLQRYLEKTGLLDATIEYLPDEETLEQRRKAGVGYTRPELATLLSYAKMDLYNQLLASDLPDAPILTPYLQAYFPAVLGKKFANEIEAHQLKREIITTSVANEMVNRMGITFMNRMCDETGHTAASITRAFIIAKKLLNADTWWHSVEALDNKVPAETQLDMLQTIKKVLEYMVFWLIRHGEQPLHMRAELEKHQQVFDVVMKQLETHLTPLMREKHCTRMSHWIGSGLSADMARKISLLQAMVCAPDISSITRLCKAKVEDVLQVYFAVGEKLKIDSLHDTLRAMPVADNWQRLATLALHEQLNEAQKKAVLQVFMVHGTAKNKQPVAAVDVWSNKHLSPITQYLSMLDELEEETTHTHAMMSVVVGQLKALAEAD